MGITTHVLDTSKGRPGSGISIVLEILKDGDWKKIASGTTNQDGRVPGFLPEDHKLEAGTYRITFDTQAYFDANSIKGFYPYVPVIFKVEDASQHYHVPLLISPFGFSTYRGS